MLKKYNVSDKRSSCRTSVRLTSLIIIPSSSLSQSSVALKIISSWTDEAKEILLAQKAKNPNASDDDLVFVNEEGRTIDRHKVNRTLKAMAKRCDCSIQDVGSHAMRHTFGAYLVTKGVSIYRVSKLMGHSSIRMTEKVYAKILASLDDDVVMSVFDELNIEK